MTFSLPKTLRRLSLLLAALVLSSCGAMMDTHASAPLPTDDVGPRAENPQAIAAAWANEHYKFWPSHPFTPEEMSISDVKPVAIRMPLVFPVGRPVGWQIILGPENERLASSVENPYTRLIIHDGAVILVESRNYPFER